MQNAIYFLQLAEEADPKLRSAEPAVWYRRLEVEHDNLRAALGFLLEQKESEMGLRLAGALWEFWRHLQRRGPVDVRWSFHRPSKRPSKRKTNC